VALPGDAAWTVAGKALYFVLLDRFARSGAAATNTTPCTGDVWCGGDLRGVIDRLDYIRAPPPRGSQPLSQDPDQQIGQSTAGLRSLDEHTNLPSSARPPTHALPADSPGSLPLTRPRCMPPHAAACRGTEGMGFDCVWISPVVQQPSGRCGASGTGYHGYWAQDWCAACLWHSGACKHA
tara:strand:+ start:70 stop:609 length:540 start_codon:yes stop_codon:yes gene_type:complete